MSMGFLIARREQIIFCSEGVRRQAVGMCCWAGMQGGAVVQGLRMGTRRRRPFQEAGGKQWPRAREHPPAAFPPQTSQPCLPKQTDATAGGPRGTEVRNLFSDSMS